MEAKNSGHFTRGTCTPNQSVSQPQNLREPSYSHGRAPSEQRWARKSLELLDQLHHVLVGERVLDADDARVVLDRRAPDQRVLELLEQRAVDAVAQCLDSRIDVTAKDDGLRVVRHLPENGYARDSLARGHAHGRGIGRSDREPGRTWPFGFVYIRVMAR